MSAFFEERFHDRLCAMTAGIGRSQVSQALKSFGYEEDRL